MLPQGGEKVFKKYSQMKLQMKRDDLEKINRHAEKINRHANEDRVLPQWWLSSLGWRSDECWILGSKVF
jgi:hypothetical protein